ncbi:MAG: VOC family protein [Pyrinomonadaceae bacterium]
MNKFTIFLSTAMVVGCVQVFAFAQAPVLLEGVKIKVPDMAEAKRFYIDTLKFGIAKESADKKTMWLNTSAYKVVLEQSKDAKRITTAGYGDVSMSMQVNDIDVTFRRLKAAGVRFIKDEKRKEGIGWSLQVLDPFGNKISMMQITVGKPEIVSEPSVYNCGIYVTDIERALSIYKDKLGFVVRSRAYMPEDMPLGTSDGKFAFMLHLRRNDFPHVENPNMLLMFGVESMKAIDKINSNGAFITKKNRTMLMRDSVGILSEILISNRPDDSK